MFNTLDTRNGRSENLGSKYCRGVVFVQKVRSSFGLSLDTICQSKQVFDNYKYKIYTPILCDTFSPNSLFGTLATDDIRKSCHSVEE